MNNNGTDRDIALQIVSALDSCATAIETFNQNLYSPIIFTQPTDQEADLNETATFSVVAGNVKSYQWQVKKTEDGSYQDSADASALTKDFTITVVNADRYDYSFRCKITGIDNSVIYSDVVHVTAPEAEPES